MNTNIAIDCRWIFPQITGIGTYTRNLVNGLIQTKKGTVVFIKQPHTRINTRQSIVISYGPFSLKNQFFLEMFLERKKVKIYHSPNFMIPMFMDRKFRVIVTIHDIIPIKYPHFTPRAKKTKYFFLARRIFKRCLIRADLVIAVSNRTKEDLMGYFSLSPEKIRVIYNSIDDIFFLPEGPKPIEERKYLLYVGRRDPYKNLVKLIYAYKFLVEDGFDKELYIVGPYDPRYPEPEDTVKKLGLGKLVKFPGYVPTKQLPELYRNAIALILPSLYEGFGLPLIEAMACGTPVIASDIPVIREVVKDNAVLFSPITPDAIKEAVLRLINDPNGYTHLVEKGRIYSKSFRKEVMAERTYKCYEELL